MKDTSFDPAKDFDPTKDIYAWQIRDFWGANEVIFDAMLDKLPFRVQPFFWVLFGTVQDEASTAFFLSGQRYPALQKMAINSILNTAEQQRQHNEVWVANYLKAWVRHCRYVPEGFSFDASGIAKAFCNPLKIKINTNEFDLEKHVILNNDIVFSRDGVENFLAVFKSFLIFDYTEAKAFFDSIPEEHKGSSEYKGDESEEHAAAWRTLASGLKGKRERKVALVVAAKWQGLSHEDAFRIAFPGAPGSNAVDFVSKARKTAEDLANKYGLPLPIWNSRS